jgi:hypothetical protein
VPNNGTLTRSPIPILFHFFLYVSSSSATTISARDIAAIACTINIVAAVMEFSSAFDALLTFTNVVARFAIG